MQHAQRALPGHPREEQHERRRDDHDRRDDEIARAHGLRDLRADACRGHGGDLFRSTKGEKYFEENKGYFWGMLESRPFMMHLLEQAMLLWDAGQRDRAVSQLQYLLELNPNDNQGVRYVLMNRLLELDRLDEAQELFDFYDEEYSADWLFSKLLLSIKSNQNKDIIEELYEEAVEENEFIIPFLVGKKKIPKVLPSFYSPGDENEAIIYVDLAQRAWKNNKKAIKMLNKFNKIK